MIAQKITSLNGGNAKITANKKFPGSILRQQRIGYFQFLIRHADSIIMLSIGSEMNR
jgi:hypothetical protein